MTGLIYMRGRYYSPAWHRFVSSDQGVDPLSINQFAYVNGSPFMATDPSGMVMLCRWEQWASYYIYKDGRTELIPGTAHWRLVGCTDIDIGRRSALGGGGGGKGKGAPKPREVTKEDCNLIRAILKNAKQHGDAAAARNFLSIVIGKGTYTNNPENNYGNLLATSRGGIDFDWFVTLLAKGGPNPPMPGSRAMGHITYAIGKTLWEGINFFDPKSREGRYQFEGPYRDPGERVAASAYADGITFGGLFDQEWFDKHCGGER
jgi:hypothetical protein